MEAAAAAASADTNQLPAAANCYTDRRVALATGTSFSAPSQPRLVAIKNKPPILIRILDAFKILFEWRRDSGDVRLPQTDVGAETTRARNPRFTVFMNKSGNDGSVALE